MNIGLAMREIYVNECPLVSRIPWVPEDKSPTERAWRKPLPPGDDLLPGNERSVALCDWFRGIENDLLADLRTAILRAGGAVGKMGRHNYRPGDLEADIRGRFRARTGKPDWLLASTDWLVGFDIWGYPCKRVESVATEHLGFPVQVAETDALPGVLIIADLHLPMGTAVALESGCVRLRTTGGAEVIDGIASLDGRLELDHPERHTWIEGVTGFAVK